jgi:predicted nucleic acid-binding protein
VVLWLKAQPPAKLFLSVVTIGEIRKGLTTFPEGRRRTELETWFRNDLRVWFRGRILPVTDSIADRWGALEGQCQLSGTPLNTADGMIAATGLEHDFTVVRRNVRDFTDLGVELFNPWDAL